MPLSLLLLRKITKKFYGFRGFARVAEWLRRSLSSSHKTVLITDYDGDLKMYCDLGEHMGSQIFWRGYYSRGQLLLLGRLLGEHSVFIDVGANQGEFTLFAAKRCLAGRVLAFEPVPGIAERLRKNIEMNSFGNVQVITSGLGDERKTSPVYTADKVYADGTTHEGLYTVFPTEQRKSRVCDIEIMPLDETGAVSGLSTLDVMKIDVEGSELSVLRGAAATIKKFRPVIIMELADETCRSAGYEPADILKHMSSLSYRCEVISDDGLTSPVPEEGLKKGFENVVCYPLK